MEKINTVNNELVYRAKGIFEHVWTNPLYFQRLLPPLPLYIISAGHTLWNCPYTMKPRQNDFYTLELVTAGEIEYTQEGRKNAIGSGAVYIQKKSVTHSYFVGPSGMLHKRFVAFDGAIADALLETTGLFRNDYVKIDTSENVIRISNIFKKINMKMVYFNNPLFNNATVPSKILNDMALLVSELIYAISESFVFTKYPEPLQKALDLISQKINGSLTVSQISRAADLSVAQCSRLFDKHFKTSPVKFFLEKKTAHAQALLRHSNLSIKEIGNRLGYSNQLYFSAQFKRVMGVSPKAYRLSE